MKENKKLKIAVCILALIVFILIVMLINTTINKRNRLNKEVYKGKLGSPYFHTRNWNKADLENAYSDEYENWNSSYYCDENNYNCGNCDNSYVQHRHRDSSHLHNGKCNNFNF